MKDCLRIAMLSVHSCPLGVLGQKDTGGMSVYIRETARQIGRRGHLVDIYTRVHDSQDPQVIELGDNVRLIHLDIGPEAELDKLMMYPRLSEFACKLEQYRAADGIGYDLIHSHYWLSGWVGEQLKQWWRIPHLIMFHTLGVIKNTVAIGDEEPELRLRTENDLVHACQRIIAATQPEKDFLIETFGIEGDAIGVVGCGVNLDLFRCIGQTVARKRLALDGEKTVLFVGRIDPLKGIDNLLVAVARLHHHNRLKLVIVGGDDPNGPEIKSLRQLACAQGIEESVNFVGSVNHEDLLLWYNAADVCAVPSYYESFGLVPLESLACGTPVVSTRVGGSEAVIDHGRTGYLVDTNDPHTLEEAIGRVVAGCNSMVRSPDDIRQTVVKYGWSQIAEQLLIEYDRLLTGPGVSGTSRSDLQR